MWTSGCKLRSDIKTVQLSHISKAAADLYILLACDDIAFHTKHTENIQ